MRPLVNEMREENHSVVQTATLLAAKGGHSHQFHFKQRIWGRLFSPSFARETPTQVFAQGMKGWGEFEPRPSPSSVAT